MPAMEKKRLHEESLEPNSFDVVCTVGTVQLSFDGDDSPYAAALRLIGEHEAEGHYTFPHGDGRTVHVTVEYS